MLAPSNLPKKYRAWNRQEGAPHGRSFSDLGWRRRFMTSRALQQFRGPFAIQPNNTTRAFEYPWAFEVAALQSDMRVLEIGGGLGGFQFVVSRFGCPVTNVDPGLKSSGRGWHCDKASIAEMNRLFGTKVSLENTTIDKAFLPEASFDRAFSISVIEHLPQRDAETVMEYAYKALKPGGLFVLTVDLFLNLRPFTSRASNEYGCNMDIASLIRGAPWKLVIGVDREIYGHPDFNPQRIQSNLESYLVGGYPALIMCLVLQKPAQPQ